MPDEGAQVVAYNGNTAQVEGANKGGQFVADLVGFVVAAPTGFVRVVEAFEIQGDDAEESGELFDLKAEAYKIQEESMETPVQKFLEG